MNNESIIQELEKIIRSSKNILDQIENDESISDEQVDLVARTAYGEARGEGRAGMQAVAEVVKNRLESPHFPDTIDEVVKQPFQFSSWNKSDKNREKLLSVTENDEQFRTAREVTYDVFKCDHSEITGGADHYHADSIRPYWADESKESARVGNHIFYNLY